MNRTDTLLRLKRFRVDEMKRRLAAIEAMQADVEKKLRDLNDNVTRERQRAGDSDIGRLAFPTFLRSIETRRENLQATLKNIAREHASAMNELTDAFQDLKSLEVAVEQQAHRLAEMAARRGQARLDEVALVRHMRKHGLRTA
jgi:flagellar export protein FliJ